MMTMLLPELRSYLEQLLDEALARAEMRMDQGTTRERVLGQLQDELIQFIFTRLMATLPPFARRQFVALLEQDAPDELLQALTERHLVDIPTFVTQAFVEFRAEFLHESKELPQQVYVATGSSLRGKPTYN